MEKRGVARAQANFFKCFSPKDLGMAKKVSLNIPDDIHKELVSLSDFYKQDVKSTIISILDVVSGEGKRVINLSKEYKVPVKLSTVISHLFRAGFDSMYGLFNDILEKLEVKGLYVLTDSEIDLDENYMLLLYGALVGCNLLVDEFDVTLESGLSVLTTKSYIKIEKVNEKALGKLEELIGGVEIPDFYDDLEDYAIEIEEDEEYLTLRIDLTAQSLGHLPSVKRISEFVERIFKKVGITR